MSYHSPLTTKLKNNRVMIETTEETTEENSEIYALRCSLKCPGTARALRKIPLKAYGSIKDID